MWARLAIHSLKDRRTPLSIEPDQELKSIASKSALPLKLVFPFTRLKNNIDSVESEKFKNELDILWHNLREAVAERDNHKLNKIIHDVDEMKLDEQKKPLMSSIFWSQRNNDDLKQCFYDLRGLAIMSKKELGLQPEQACK